MIRNAAQRGPIMAAMGKFQNHEAMYFIAAIWDMDPNQPNLDGMVEIPHGKGYMPNFKTPLGTTFHKDAVPSFTSFSFDNQTHLVKHIVLIPVNGYALIVMDTPESRTFLLFYDPTESKLYFVNEWKAAIEYVLSPQSRLLKD